MKNFIDRMFTLIMLGAFLFIAFWGVTYVGKSFPPMEISDDFIVAITDVAFAMDDESSDEFLKEERSDLSIISVYPNGEVVFHSFGDEYYCRTTTFSPLDVYIENMYTGEKGSEADYFKYCVW